LSFLTVVGGCHFDTSPGEMASLSSIDVSSAAIIAVATWLAYIVAQAVHRLYLCPIASFPGPKLAALSFW